ncbi:dihydroorotase [archaeon]|jgi:dihydroorotase|nr:dihydroorotase [archaeon]MBT4241643.1 dihydroorotase [archaeon]MBT4418038.1 dihydroorotase [archaeon]
MIARIDSHVHCRDWFQEDKETIAHALRVAERNGLDGIFDMPNCDPAITTKDLARLRLREAEKAQSNVFYGLYLGLSSDPNQIKEMVETYKEFFPKEDSKVGVVGLKMYAGHSVGDLTVADLKGQKRVYETLSNLGYDGVLTVHCEKEELMRDDLWEFEKPITHSYARPEKAEVESVRDQIILAERTGYAISEGTGKLHIAHVSTPKSIDLINNAKGDLNITSEVAPHHLLLDNGIMTLENEGIAYKVNPPLRKPETRRLLFERFIDGEIDTLASDHAPHTRKQKFKHPYMSGIPALAFWPQYLEALEDEIVRVKLQRENQQVDVMGVLRTHARNMLERMMGTEVDRIFGTNIKSIEERGLKREFQAPDENDRDSYAFDPTEHLPSSKSSPEQK